MLSRLRDSPLLDLVLPRACAGCGRVGVLLCGRCQPRAPAVALAGPVWAAGAYEGGLRAALLAYKERGRRELARPLGRLLATALPPVAGGCVLVPVPSRPAAVRARGGDHVLRLARVTGREAGVAVVPVLQLQRSVLDSARLTRRQRHANLGGAMRARPPAGRAAAIVVDDIVTTGATLREAARALRAAGWPVAGAAVVAATAAPGHDTDSAAPIPGTDEIAGLAW